MKIQINNETQKMIEVEEIMDLKNEWETLPRWKGVCRNYTANDVVKVRPSVGIRHTLAELGAERLWKLLHQPEGVRALGALTGNQAVQQVRAGLKAIYLSGWQVAADANLSGQMYPDQSLYPSNSVPHVVKRINQALQRADEIERTEGKGNRYYFDKVNTIVSGGQVSTLAMSGSTEEEQFAPQFSHYTSDKDESDRSYYKLRDQQGDAYDDCH